MNKQRIMTINAKSLFKYYPKKKDAINEPYCFDTRKRTLYTLVVKEENEWEECPMKHQLLEVLKKKLGNQFDENQNDLFHNQFLIMDFEDIFMPIDENASESARGWKERLQNSVKDLMENGLDLYIDADHTVHMMPFDKSGNMSRNGRISFVNDSYIKQLNQRLNLGIDFGDIGVKLSKYYAYRGLYLSTSQRVKNSEKFMLTPETIIVVKDKRKKKDQREIKAQETNKKVAGGESFERDVAIATAIPGATPKDWVFQEPEVNEIFTVGTPFDGEGLIVPEYSKYINKSLGLKGANSFQIRLPFAKGMLHEVDVLSFIDEFTCEGEGKEKYTYEDAFGIKRDLRKGKIFLTESMFKGKEWIRTYCEKNKIADPMQYYCAMIKEYNHGFYVSGTNLPYGHSKYTHLSYQTINTLAFDEEQFKRILEEHGKFIENPIEYFKCWNEIEQDDVVKAEMDDLYRLPNWKRAVLHTPSLAGDKYIKEQLDNTRKSLLSKIALGKILVKGQTRYLCRDLMPLLSSLLQSEKDIADGYLRNLYTRFYMPRGKQNSIRLNFTDYYAFFRNPHLSRNEQYMMRAFVLPKSEQEYAKDGKKDYEHYVKYVKMYDKYFGHLTGIVMIPRGSTLPLCLGGADFDGDLVSVILNQDVVSAVAKGVYEYQSSDSLYWYKRVLPAINIPSTGADEVVVPDYVQYDHIYNTFSNHIGRISNAAIAIGQNEYDRRGVAENEFDVNLPTCSKCTLLTGLEIDAAKNGVHPNLDLILNTGVPKSAYLAFLNAYKELKEEEYFHLDNLSFKKEKKIIDGVEKEIILISADSCETEIEWNPEEEEKGTYINWLPKYFMEYHKVYKKQRVETVDVKIQEQTKLSKMEKDVIKEFKTSFDNMYELYNFYKGPFLKRLKKEKNKGYYAVENTESLLMRTYDRNHVDEILFQTLPMLRERIEQTINYDNSLIEGIRERMNGLHWQFQPRNKRGEMLEQIIGNGFAESELTEQERNLIYHFNQQGYKLLWRLLDLIEGPKIAAYDEIYDEVLEEKERNISDEFDVLNAALDDASRNYYENNVANITTTLYMLCLNTLKNLIERYAISIEGKEKLVHALYQKTKSSTGKAKFFWDVFEWDDIKTILEAEAKRQC